jgi:hypothetical protein
VAFLRSAVTFEGLTRGEIFSRLFFWWFGPGFVGVFLSLWFDFRLSREPLFSLLGPALTAFVVWRDATRARLANPLFLAAVAGLVPVLGWLYYAWVRAPGTVPPDGMDAAMAPPNRPGALRRLLDPFANERVVLSTRLSASECTERLRQSKVSLLAPSSWFSLNRARPVHGRVSADGFALKRRHPLTRESLMTQASGRYEDRAGAGLIRVRIGVSLFDRVWTILFLGVVALLTLTFTAASPTSGQDTWMFGVFPALVFAFVYLVVRFISLDDDVFLYQFLLRTLEASDVTASEPL